MVSHSFARDSLSIFITKIFVILLSIGVVIILARGLGPEKRGLLAALLIYPQLLISLTEGGMRQAATYFIGKKLVKEGEVVGALIAYVLSAGLFGYFIAFSLMWWTGAEKFSLAMMLIAAAIIPTTLCVNAFKGFFLGRQELSRFNRSSWLERLIYVALLSLLFITDYLSVATAAIATALAALFNAMQAWMYVRKINRSTIEYNLYTTWRMLKIGLVYAIALFLINANYKLDILMLGLLSNVTEVGYYVVSVQISELMWQLPGAVMLVLMSRSANNDDLSSDWSGKVAIICRILIVITACSAFLMMWIIFFGMELVFGLDYKPAVPITIMLLFASIFMIPFKSLNADLAGEGKPKYSIYTMIPSVIVNIAANLFLIPLYGASGAALATILSYMVSGILIVGIYSYIKGIGVSTLVVFKKSDMLLVWNCLMGMKKKYFDKM